MGLSSHESADVNDLVVEGLCGRRTLFKMKPVLDFFYDPGQLRALLHQNIYLFLQFKRFKFHFSEIQVEVPELPESVQHLMYHR